MAAAVFTSRNVEIGGLRFHYTDWDGDGPPLVMLHGLTGHARTWDDTAAALSDRYHVLALDQRGHGDTDWAPRYGFVPMAGDLLGFLDALDLREVTLMGSSMGGIVSFVFAAAHPERVRRLVVLDIGPESAAAGATNVATALAAKYTPSAPRMKRSLRPARATRDRPTEEFAIASRTACVRCRTGRSPSNTTRRSAMTSGSPSISPSSSDGKPGEP